ncbi:MAG TPA: molybdopterin-dependent oxidoreductase, partial [Pseudomonadales bacterium]
MSEETRYTFCRICESLCGLEVRVQNGAVREIRPDARHVTTGGFACPKGLFQHELYASPDRLLRPRRRGPAGWGDVSWETALAEIGAKVRDIVETSGPDAVAMYVGTAAGFGVLHPVFAQGFMTGLGSGNMYASATQDCANKFAVAQRLYGFPFTLPFPDVARTSCLIIVGANPMVSKWSFLQVPNPRRHINAIRERGGRVIVVDPRRTETAKAAGEHVFIRPGTDLQFYLAFLNELIAVGGVDRTLVSRHTTGFDEVRKLAEPFTAEATAPVTGIEPAVLRDLVRAYLAADGAALYCSTGVNMSANGTLAYWIQEVINTVSGNLDRAGGSLVAKGVIDFARFGRKHNLLVKDDRSRIGGFTKTNDAFPGGILADEILTPGRGQIRALFVTGGNPLMTMADADKLKRAFESLDLLVCLDIQPSETAQIGHYMLPCTSPLERPDLPFIFPLMLGLQARPYLQATEAVLEPPGEVRDEATIYLDLAAACGRPLFGSRVFQGIMRALVWANRLLRPGDASYAALPQ